jgi:hypothetical protein
VARIRSVKPEFFTHPKMGSLARDVRLAYIGLWTEADDEGRLLDSPKLLAGSLFPWDDDVTVKRFSQWLDELVRVGSILRYSVENAEYIQILSWHHQRISRPTSSRFPGPNPEIIQNLSEEDQTGFLLSRARVDQGAGSKEQGTGNREAFEEFWTIYPRRAGKVDARKAYERATAKTDPTLVLAGAQRFAADPNLPRDDPQFIPHPATWLNAGRWDDDPLPHRNGNGKAPLVKRPPPKCRDCGKSLDRQPVVNTQAGPKCTECAA